MNLTTPIGAWKLTASKGEATKEVSCIVEDLRNPLGVNLRLHTPHQIDVSNRNVLIITCGRYTDGSLVFGNFFVSISVVKRFLKRRPATHLTWTERPSSEKGPRNMRTMLSRHGILPAHVTINV